MIEMIFTLSIMIILFSLTLGNIDLNGKKIDFTNIRLTMTSFLEEARNMSLLHHEKISLEFSDQQIKYHFQNQDYVYTLPNEYYFTNIKDIYFNQNGNINMANHIDIVHHQQTHQIIFHLGAGDFDIQ